MKKLTTKQKAVLLRLVLVAASRGVDAKSAATLFNVDSDDLNNGGVSEVMEKLIREGDDEAWITQQLQSLNVDGSSKVRNHIPVIDVEGREVSFHGIAIAPEGLSIKQAKSVVQQCYDAAVKANPEEWNFGEMMDQIGALPGWDTVVPNDTHHDIWIE